MGVGPAGADPTAGRRAWPLLVGRDQELEQLFGMIDQIAAGGGALVIRGEAGIGKSALLAAAQQRARERGTAVVTTTGTPSEGRMAFGGLHQLLAPFLDRVDHRPDPQRKALDVAFGVTEGDAPDLFLVGLASLGVVTDREAQTPLLLAVDDAHWLDRSSAEVLAFVARRLEMEPVILLFAVRDSVPSVLDEAGLPDLTLAGLDDGAARMLLDVNEAGLSEDLMARILAAAAGNPLALIELPAAAVDLDVARTWEPLPLTARLEATFTTRLIPLDANLRTVALLAALDDGTLAELNRAAEELLGARFDAEHWTTAAATATSTWFAVCSASGRTPRLPRAPRTSTFRWPTRRRCWPTAKTPSSATRPPWRPAPGSGPSTQPVRSSRTEVGCVGIGGARSRAACCARPPGSSTRTACCASPTARAASCALPASAHAGVFRKRGRS